MHDGFIVVLIKGMFSVQLIKATYGLRIGHGVAYINNIIQIKQRSRIMIINCTFAEDNIARLHCIAEIGH